MQMLRGGRKHRIFIVDQEPLFRSALELAIGAESDLEVVGSADNGRDAVDRLQFANADVLIIDVVLPEMDGITLLDELRERKLLAGLSVMALCSYTSSFITNELRAHNVSCIAMKPVTREMLVERLRAMIAAREEPSAPECRTPVRAAPTEMQRGAAKPQPSVKKDDILYVISQKLHDLGVPAHINGYQFVRESILICIGMPSYINSITKTLYPKVAKIFATTPQRVERSIRHAIEVAWERGDIEELQNIFSYTVSDTKGRPTNSEFIAMLADHFSLMLRMPEEQAINGT